MRYLGIDLGTSSVKAVLVSEDGALVRETSVAYPTAHPEPGTAEQDPAHWWTAVGEAVRALNIGDAADLRSIGLSGQMHGTVCLDGDGRVIRPAIIWSDTRGAATADALTRQITRPRLASTCGTALAAGFLGVTAAWLREHEPETWKSLRTVLLPKDYIRYRLAGKVGTDPSDGAGTGLLDVQTRAWSAEMCAAVGLELGQVPPILGSADVAGQLTDEAAAHLHVSKGIPVVTGGADAPLAAIGTGLADDAVLATLSSGAQVISLADRPVVDPGLRVHTFASPLDQGRAEPGWYIMGATMVAGSALRWLRSNVFHDQDDESVGDLIETAATVPPGANGLIFAPYLTGERTPHLDPAARAVFLGLTADHDRRHLTRAVLEGVVFALRDAFDVVQELQPGAGEVVLAGGGARSPLWRQIVADIFEMPVRPSLLADQSAIGAAALAAAADLGEGAGAVGRRWARYDDTVQPISANVATYAQLRPIFRRIYASHAEDFQRLARLG